MNVYFANPLGWTALLAALPLVYLHFFRRQTRKRVVNTLFLVDKASQNREAGNLRERWRQSASFWLQLLALALLAWLLSEPRWADSHKLGKVAIVLDSSASLSSFEMKAAEQVAKLGDLMERRLPQVEFTLLESGQRGAALYRGRKLADLIDGMASWKPRMGSHSALQRLKDAREWAGRDGVVVWVSDQENLDTPAGVESLLVGESIENVGVAGARSFRSDGADGWRAIVTNYGRETARREWWLEFEGGKSPSKLIEIEAGKSLALEGRFPEGETAVSIALSEDAFVLDDYAPLVVERGKVLSVWIPSADPNAGLFHRLAESMSGSRFVEKAEEADLKLLTVSPDAAWDGNGPGIYFVASDGENNRPLAGGVNIPSNHEHNTSLSWEGLYTREGRRLEAAANDLVLLWQDAEALIFLRGEALVFNFELRESNLDRIPAFVLLVWRYFDALRERKPGFASVNCDVGQSLVLPLSQDRGTAQLLAWRGDKTDTDVMLIGPRFEAPSEPAFFRVEQAGESLMFGAARFADVRESNFQRASSRFDFEAFDASLVESYYDADFYSSFWLLCLGGVMLAAWAACYRENL
ncbi:BatA domain-containing protein [Pelagicoccus sp. NFK12]|uniref:BatA domain-containing protein n=1 Tax=Pelagicoccus enzymogenes TaxID=2773457 RepID=A0A927F6N8_9BACT|nr:BatA domain-containing protein [Pelagicoccus enzymogenes]MBD5778849.1 BatA domain-containing protein [Pelagicoccus enzymogenes]